MIRVASKPDAGCASGVNTLITDESGEDLGTKLCISSVDIAIRPRAAATVTLGVDLIKGVDVETDDVTYNTINPATGKRAPLSALIFQDGTTVAFGKGGAFDVGHATDGAQHCPLVAAMLAVLNTVPDSVKGVSYPTHVSELLTRGLEEAGLKLQRGADGMFVAEAG
ncbi:hypothetical protein [Azospirillum sp. TSO5]|uniref:hypothetical protein n=1 Tax=Azospirillum sp. TSO5 TaxID=716760 RepID=UPI000D619443|nr:hypothetical protein [Azospirillum sp. TSO5]PWC95463.1 hypothetical protein TSO5_10600 [Azospirillum sp. TSO5]